jgi:hypothetical protein
MAAIGEIVEARFWSAVDTGYSLREAWPDRAGKAAVIAAGALLLGAAVAVAYKNEWPPFSGDTPPAQ